MKKEDWDAVQNFWGNPGAEIALLVDGYRLDLRNIVDKKKMSISVFVYVDGHIKGEWFSYQNDHEIGRRFYKTSKAPYWPPAWLKETRKIFGAKHEFAQQGYYERKDMAYKSFSAFKCHLISNNVSIELIKK